MKTRDRIRAMAHRLGRTIAGPSHGEPPPSNIVSAGPLDAGRALVLDSPMCAVTYATALDEQTIADALLLGSSNAEWLTKPAVKLEDGVYGLPTQSGVVFVLLVDAPLPLGGMRNDPAQQAAWPNWQDEAATWQTHVMVSLKPRDRTLATLQHAAVNVLRTAVILADKTAARGVEWSASELFYPADNFILRCGYAPLPVDVLFRTDWYAEQWNDRRVIGARTEGLRLFGLPEIDHKPNGEGAYEISRRLLNLAYYLLHSGAVINDGDTVGIDPQVQARIHHRHDQQGNLVLAYVHGDTAASEFHTVH